MQHTPRIDVHGMTGEAAERAVGVNLRAFQSQGFPEVAIIHGHGAGILKARIRAMLNKFGYRWRPGRYGEGEDGVTIVIFNR